MMSRRQMLAVLGCSLSEQTATGNPATFTSTAAKPLLQCQAAFEPVQSGSGDPSPENVRPIAGWTGVNVTHCGKNLIDSTKGIDKARINIAGEVTDASDYKITDYIKVEPSTDYYLSGEGTLASNARVGFYDANKTLINTTGTFHPITTPIGCAYVRCSYLRTNVATVQLELGSTATSYEPYTGAAYPVTFPAVGKNLLKNTLSTTTLPNGITATVNADKSITLTGTSSGTGSLQIGTISLPVGGYTALKAVSNDVYINIAGVTNIYDTNKSFSVTSAISDRSVSIQIKSGVTLNDTIYPQIEAGYTATAYEPYTNTVYGGYVDLVTGVLTATHGIKKLSEEISGYQVNWGGRFRGDVKDMAATPTSIVADIICESYQSSTNTGADKIICRYSNVIYVKDLSFDGDVDAFKEAMGNYQFVYPLATPLTYQLTPQQITALVGANNIWSDANGDMTIKYLTKN